MKKIKTLKKNYEFKNVLSKGNFFIGRYLIIYIKKNNKNDNFIGIAVSKKTCKAVKRNRIKRLIRENYRLLNYNSKSLKKGNDIVFLPNKKANIDEINFFNIKEDMIKIFKKAKMV